MTIATATATLSRPDLPRLTAVELRKMVDTRAGFWLLLSVQLLAGAVVTMMLFSASPDQQNFGSFLATTLFATSLVLPLLGILAVTGEWSQRTGLTTFALVPERERVIAAKLAAAVVLALLSVVVCLACAAVGNVIAGGSWDTSLDQLGEGALFEVLAMLGGVGFGLAFLNSPLAIVAFFLLPRATDILGERIGAFEKPADWLEMARVVEPMVDQDVSMTGTDWVQLATASGLWVGAFLVLGFWRLRRTEVK
jgi:ABC-2 type transport system permease protein